MHIRRQHIIAGLLAALLALGGAACESTGDGGDPAFEPGGDPAEDLPADTGEQDL